MNYPSVGDKIGERYQVGPIIGSGGLGYVHSARVDRSLALTEGEFDLAIKYLRPENAENVIQRLLFERECEISRLLSELQSDVFVDVVDVVDQGSSLKFLVMKLIEGGTLADLLNDGRGQILKKSNYREIIRIVCGILKALDLMHSNGIVKKDLTPDNVMMETSGRVKLIDFGLAIHLDEDDDYLIRGSIVGTPNYISPEICLGGGFAEVDSRADLYSLGVLLYRLLTGTLPFKGTNMSVLYQHVRREVPEMAKEIPESLRLLTYKLLEKKPDKRPSSAKEVGERLVDICFDLDLPNEYEELEYFRRAA